MMLFRVSIKPPSIICTIHPIQTSSFPEPIRRRCCKSFVRASDEKESKFDVDQEKVRDALKKLDEQLYSLSQRETEIPRKKPSTSYSEAETDAKPMMGLRKEEMSEFSGSFLASSAVILLVFTLLYNLLFTNVVQPYVDGFESDPTIVRESFDEEVVVQQLS